MTLKISLLAAASALALSAGAAAAAPATTETSLNMRTGPGTEFEVIRAIPAGATVDVAGCTGSWCQVSYRGESGFASRSYLAMAGGPGPAVGVAVAPGYAYDDTPYYYGDDYYDYGYYGPSVGIFVGPRHHRFHRRWDHGWNGGRVGTWTGGNRWHGNPGWSGNRAGTAQGGGGRNFQGATIGGRGSVNAPVGMSTGGSPGVFRGGAGAVRGGGGAPAAAAHVGGGGQAGGPRR